MRFLTAVALAAVMLWVPVDGVAQEETRIGEFYYVPNIDEFDDTDRGTIHVLADDPDEGREPMLYWACMRDGLNVVLYFDQYYAGDEDDDILVRYRFDQTPASDQEYWPLLNSDAEAAYIPMSRVSTFSMQALMASRVVMEATDPFDGESHRFRFSLDGLEAASRKLPCWGW